MIRKRGNRFSEKIVLAAKFQSDKSFQLEAL